MSKKTEDNYGLMALSQARKLKELMNALENTTVGALASQVATLQNQVTALQASHASHTHTYVNSFMTDTADGSGVLTQETKNTGVKN